MQLNYLLTGGIQVVCGSCSRQWAPLAYMSYRLRRVCDNCDLVLRHKTQRGLRCHGDSSLAAGPAVDAADVCLIGDELLSRNNQPLGSNVSNARETSMCLKKFSVLEMTARYVYHTLRYDRLV